MKALRIRISVAIFAFAVAEASAASLPFGFQPNAGRFDPRISFVAQGSQYAVSLESGAVRFLLTGKDHESGTVTLRFPGAIAAHAIPDGPPLGRVNYFIGDAPARWTQNLDQYLRVRYPNLYDGIDLALYENAGRLEHDFIVRPGADPAVIALAFSGAAPLRLAPDGALLIRAAQGELRFEPPALYQEIDGKKATVEGRYRLDRAARTVRFSVGEYDRTRPLVIDPTVVFSVSLTGSGVQTGLAVANDTQGNMYIAGVTTSTDLQLLNPAQKTFGGGIGDCFVAKWDSTGNLIYATYLGGSSQDQPQQILVDSQGNTVVLGFTHSPDFPTVNPLPSGGYPSPNPDVTGKSVSFIAKLDPTGSKLVYSTLLWSNNLETYNSTGMALDSAGNAYLVGFDALLAAPAVSSPRLTPTSGAYKAPKLGINVNHAWVAKLSTAGALVWDIVIGGSNQEQASGIDVDSSGKVYVAGFTGSTDFPVTQNNGVQQTLTSKAAGNAFLAVLSSDGSQLVYGTYFGGSGTDIGNAVAVIPGQGVAIGGLTTSPDLPVTSDAEQKTLAQTPSGFFAFLKPPGVAIPAATARGDFRPLDTTSLSGVASSTYESDPIATMNAVLTILLPAGFGVHLEEKESTTGLLKERLKTLGLPPKQGNITFPLPSGTNAATLWLSSQGSVLNIAGGSLTVPPPPQQQRAALVAATTAGSAVGLRYAYTFATVNAASFAPPSAVSPGEIVTLYGDNLGPSTLTTAQLDSTGQKLSTSVGDTQVFFDNDPAPIVYTSASQVSVIVPYSVQGETSIGVFPMYNGALQNAAVMNVAASAPGIFTADGKQAAALNQDGSYNSASNPAPRGSTVVLFATGEGQTSPTGVDGQLATATYPKPVLPVSVTIGGQTATVAYYGAAPGETAGLMQLNLVVPQNIQPGNAAVVLTVGSTSSQSGVTIAVN